MGRILIAAAFGLAAAVAALVLYAGVMLWWMSRDLPPDVAVGFDPVSMPLWMWLPFVAVFAAGFVVSYRRGRR